MNRHSFVLSLAVTTLAALGLAGQLAAQQQVPFRGNFAGTSITTSFDPNTNIACGIASGTGNATHLGQFAFQHPHCVNFSLGPSVPFVLTGNFRFVAANGDEVFAYFEGTSTATLTPGVRLVSGNAIVTGGTGRFLGATGSFNLQRFFNFTTNRTVGSFDGTISSPGATRR